MKFLAVLCRNEQAPEDNDMIIDFAANNNNALFKFKQQITGQTGNCHTKDVEIMVLLEYLSNFWRTPEMRLINCEISFQLKWSKICILVNSAAANQNPGFQIQDTKVYLPVVTLSSQENITFLKQLECGFKRAINWSKCLPKATNQAQNRYLDFLIDPSFLGVNKLFALSFKHDDGRECHK